MPLLLRQSAALAGGVAAATQQPRPIARPRAGRANGQCGYCVAAASTALAAEAAYSCHCERDASCHMTCYDECQSENTDQNASDLVELFILSQTMAICVTTKNVPHSSLI